MKHFPDKTAVSAVVGTGGVTAGIAAQRNYIFNNVTLDDLLWFCERM